MISEYQERCVRQPTGLDIYSMMACMCVYVCVCIHKLEIDIGMNVI